MGLPRRWETGVGVGSVRWEMHLNLMASVSLPGELGFALPRGASWRRGGPLLLVVSPFTTSQAPLGEDKDISQQGFAMRRGQRGSICPHPGRA